MPILGTIASSRPAGGGPYGTPPVTTNLWGWYDGADATTMTVSSGNISQWNNKSPASGGPNMTQSTGSRQPNLVSNVQFGRSAVQFVRTSEDHVGSTSQPTSGSGAFTLFAVINTSNTSSLGAGIGPTFVNWGTSNYVGGGVDTGMLATDNATPGKISVGYAGGTTEHIYSTNTFNNTWVVVCYTGSGTSITAQFNGTDNQSKTTTSVNVSANNEFFIGWLTNPWYGSGAFNGYIGDVLVHQTVLSGAQQTQQINWLKSKWNIT